MKVFQLLLLSTLLSGAALAREADSRFPRPERDAPEQQAPKPAWSETTPLADPYAYFAADGTVEVYGTGAPLRYPSRDAFVHHRDARSMRAELRLVNPNGTAISDDGAWDLHKFDWPTPDGKRIPILTGGMMVRPDLESEGVWGEGDHGGDNISRRSYLFTPNGKGQYVRSEKPIFGVPSHRNWMGHTYGRHVLTDGSSKAEVGSDGKGFLYYEKVSRIVFDADGNPQRLTEIFGRKFKVELVSGQPRLAVDAREYKLIGIRTPRGWPEFPVKPDPHEDASRAAWVRHDDPGVAREVTGLLVEGPRVTRLTLGGKTHYLMGFSGGDFPTDRYGLNFAVSASPLGPFKPITHPDGRLRDFGADLKGDKLTGVGRPFVWSDRDGRSWVTFHAFDRTQQPEHDYRRYPASREEWGTMGERRPLTLPLEVGEDARHGLRIELKRLPDSLK